MAGLTDLTSVLEFAYGSLCVGDSSIIIIISDFIATERFNEIQEMLDKTTDKNTSVCTIYFIMLDNITI